tara:strand:- start:5180 stop:6199 length:1020 start_codon:yes stop_codon:yes gene_type:complete
MALSFVGFNQARQAIEDERTAAATAQKNQEWKELIRQDSLDAKAQAQENFLRSIKSKRFEAFGKASTKYFNDRKPSSAVLADLAFLKERVGEVESGNEWLTSLGKNPVIISAAAKAVRDAKENLNIDITGEDLVANFKIIGSSSDPEAALQEFATKGDLFQALSEGDIQDDTFFFDLLSRASVAPTAPTTSYRIVDPQKLGMGLPSPEDYKKQKDIWNEKVNELMDREIAASLSVDATELDTTRIRRVKDAQEAARNGDNSERDFLFGQAAWDDLYTSIDNEQIFGSAFTRPTIGIETPPVAPTAIPSLEDFKAQVRIAYPDATDEQIEQQYALEYPDG